MEITREALSPQGGSAAGVRSSSRTPSTSRTRTDDSIKAGRVWAREPEEDPWTPCILALDGGGIRGYSSLLLLEELMLQVRSWETKLDEEERSNGSEYTPLSEEELLPCHYFDFMYGTSTGGLIAIMLGRLRMSVARSLESYRDVGERLFGRKRSIIPLMTKYHHEPLEEAVRAIVRQNCPNCTSCSGTDMFPCLGDGTDSPQAGVTRFDPDQPRVCQACCLAAANDDRATEAHLLRSYNHHCSPDAESWAMTYNKGADMLRIWEVARATTAAPFYFDMVEARIGDTPISFKDGGIRENNPVGAAFTEFRTMYEGKLERPSLLLSIGTGGRDRSADGFAHGGGLGFLGRIGWVKDLLEKGAIFRNLFIKYTDGEHAHLRMREQAQGEHQWYKRLNVSGDEMIGMSLDDWVKGDWNGQQNFHGGKTLTRMEQATSAYLLRDFDPELDSYAAPSVMVNQIAEKLVRQRRARERADKLRWDVFVGRRMAAQ